MAKPSEKMKTGKVRGIWFYGYAGSGKTLASNYIKEFFPNPFLIDGDNVRKLISTDLNYSKGDRLIQIKRVLGLTRLAISNKCFPISTTVAMTSEVFEESSKLNIRVVRISRPFNQIEKIRSIYKSEKDVVGKDINFEKLGTPEIFNDGTASFLENLNEYANKI